MTHRFFVDEEVDEYVTLRGDQAHQIANVLRLQPGAHVTVVRNDIESDVKLEAVTQLGVSRIVPFVSARSVVRTLAPAKRERWARVAREAAETARRGRIPAIDEPREWDNLFDALDAPVVIAWEGEVLTKLGDAIPQALRFSLVIGPEGGLAMEEIALARDKGAVTGSLGRRNLRSETAAIAAVALVMAARD